MEEQSTLVDREQAAKLIGCPVITLKRIEADGSLRPIYLRPGPTSKAYYRRADVIEFAEHGVGKRKAASKKVPK